MKMNVVQKKNLLTISIIGIVYFCVFILPNLAGSKHAIMLSVFEQDEFAEYPFVLRMLTSNLTFLSNNPLFHYLSFLLLRLPFLFLFCALFIAS